MNHIHRLELDIARARAMIAAYQEGLLNLRRYLWSEKFRLDTTVQVGDVFLRLDETERAVSLAENTPDQHFRYLVTVYHLPRGTAGPDNIYTRTEDEAGKEAARLRSHGYNVRVYSPCRADGTRVKLSCDE